MVTSKTPILSYLLFGLASTLNLAVFHVVSSRLGSTRLAHNYRNSRTSMNHSRLWRPRMFDYEYARNTALKSHPLNNC